MFIFVTLLPITLYGILLYNKSSEIIQDKVNLSISEALTQISTSTVSYTHLTLPTNSLV